MCTKCSRRRLLASARPCARARRRTDTANLAAFLTESSVGFYYSSIDAMIEEQAVVCVAAAVEHEMRTAYPSAVLRVVSFSGDLGQEYVGNGCDGVIWSMAVAMRVPATAEFMCRADLVAVENVLQLAFGACTGQFQL